MSYKRLTFRYKSIDGTEQIGHTEQLLPFYDKQKEILKRLAELEDKIEQGKMLELPCKVGDIVYKVVKSFIVEYRVHKIEFTILETKQFSYCLYCDNYDLGDFDYFYKKQIGKDVFLTKAEAKKRLKELQQ